MRDKLEQIGRDISAWFLGTVADHPWRLLLYTLAVIVAFVLVNAAFHGGL